MAIGYVGNGDVNTIRGNVLTKSRAEINGIIKTNGNVNTSQNVSMDCNAGTSNAYVKTKGGNFNIDGIAEKIG